MLKFVKCFNKPWSLSYYSVMQDSVTSGNSGVNISYEQVLTWPTLMTMLFFIFIFNCDNVCKYKSLTKRKRCRVKVMCFTMCISISVSEHFIELILTRDQSLQTRILWSLLYPSITQSSYIHLPLPSCQFLSQIFSCQCLFPLSHMSNKITNVMYLCALLLVCY